MLGMEIFYNKSKINFKVLIFKEIKMVRVRLKTLIMISYKNDRKIFII